MMNLDGNVRLDQALELLGYNETQPSHHRYNLLASIEMFASVSHDESLEYACQARINMIRAENAPRKTVATNQRLADLSPEAILALGQLYGGDST